MQMRLTTFVDLNEAEPSQPFDKAAAIQHLNESPTNAIAISTGAYRLAVFRGAGETLDNFFYADFPLEDPNDAEGGEWTAEQAIDQALTDTTDQFSIEAEIDLTEKMNGWELSQELEGVIDLVKKKPDVRYGYWDETLFVVYSGPEITEENRERFDKAVAKHVDPDGDNDEPETDPRPTILGKPIEDTGPSFADLIGDDEE